MGQQLAFDLPLRTALGRDDFFVSQANQTAVAALEDWPNWPDDKMLIFGPLGSGKTHLAHVWAKLANAQIIDARDLHADNVAQIVAGSAHIAVEDIHLIAADPAKEQALFHLHNLALVENVYLLLSGTGQPARWPIALPDLQSRLSGTKQVEMHAPDDALLAAVLVKLFADRQLAVGAGLIDYLTTHIERSFDAARALVAVLDEQALREGRPLNRTLAAKVVQNLPRAQQ